LIGNLRHLKELDIRCCQLETKDLLEIDKHLREDSPLTKVLASLNTFNKKDIEEKTQNLNRLLDKPKNGG
jgi:hypothetical protein